MLISDMYLETEGLIVYICMFGILLYLLPVSVDVLDKGVGDPVPGERLTSGSSKQRVVAKMGGCVDHLFLFA